MAQLGSIYTYIHCFYQLRSKIFTISLRLNLIRKQAFKVMNSLLKVFNGTEVYDYEDAE